VLTVPEAARRAGRDPETIRRWIRSGKWRARKVGTQHVIDETDLETMLSATGSLALPPAWRTTRSGAPMPDVVGALHRSRAGR
jgi:excisionase family DNA binding protein